MEDLIYLFNDYYEFMSIIYISLNIQIIGRRKTIVHQILLCFHFFASQMRFIDLFNISNSQLSLQIATKLQKAPARSYELTL